MGFSQSSYSKNIDKKIGNVTVNETNDKFKLEKTDFKPLMDSLQSVMQARIERLTGTEEKNTNNFAFVDINVARFLYQKHEQIFKKILSNKSIMDKFSKELENLVNDVLSDQNISKFSKDNIRKLNEVILETVNQSLIE